MGRENKKIGKYTYEVIELNQPSEEASLDFRKAITKIMNEKFNK